MKQLLLLFLVLQSACICQAQKTFYTEIDSAKYYQRKIADTLLKRGSFLVTSSNEPGLLRRTKEYVRIDYGSHKRYFSLDVDAHLLNDTTIAVFSAPFKVTATEGSYMKNGIWVYTTFYRENKNTQFIDGVGERGRRYVVDSIPPTWDYKRLPTKEGIYFYQGHALVQVSTVQSEEVFGSLNKDGCYFFPNSGRLFSKHHLREIK